MNIHPIFVHFPIALLSIYTLMEIVNLKILRTQHWWFHTKAVLLFLGTIGGGVALLTGKMAEDAYRGTPTMALVHLHSTYAQLTVWVFGVLSALYIIAWLHQELNIEKLPDIIQTIGNILIHVETALFRSALLIPASIIGLALIIITGALGGALVYGPDVDPIVSAIYHLVYKQ